MAHLGTLCYIIRPVVIVIERKMQDTQIMSELILVTMKRETQKMQIMATSLVFTEREMQETMLLCNKEVSLLIHPTT